MSDPALLLTIDRVRRGVASRQESDQICDLLLRLLADLDVLYEEQLEQLE